MSQRNQEHMMMPSQPAAHFVMIHSDFAFGFFKDGFNRPTHAAHPHQLAQRCMSGSIAEIVFDHRRVIQIAADNQPKIACGQVAARFGCA